MQKIPTIPYFYKANRPAPLKILLLLALSNTMAENYFTIKQEEVDLL